MLRGSRLNNWSSSEREQGRGDKCMFGKEQTTTADREQARLGEAEITGYITTARHILNCHSTGR
jgi:hypothetical protein